MANFKPLKFLIKDYKRVLEREIIGFKKSRVMDFEQKIQLWSNLVLTIEAIIWLNSRLFPSEKRRTFDYLLRLNYRKGKRSGLFLREQKL